MKGIWTINVKIHCKLSSDEFRTLLEIIRNSIKNVEFEFQIRGQIWSFNSNLTKFDRRIWSNLVKFDLRWLNLVKYGQIWSNLPSKWLVEYDHKIWIRLHSAFELKIWKCKNRNLNEFKQICPSLLQILNRNFRFKLCFMFLKTQANIRS